MSKKSALTRSRKALGGALFLQFSNDLRSTCERVRHAHAGLIVSLTLPVISDCQRISDNEIPKKSNDHENPTVFEHKARFHPARAGK